MWSRNLLGADSENSLEGDSQLSHRGGIKLWFKWPWNKPLLDPGSELNCVSLDCLHTTPNLSSLPCDIGLRMTEKAKMLMIVINEHPANPNNILGNFKMEQKTGVSRRARGKAGKSPIPPSSIVWKKKKKKNVACLMMGRLNDSG